jgi:hypothetical protein
MLGDEDAQLHCGRKRLPGLVGHGIFLLADTLREWKNQIRRGTAKQEKSV